MKILPKMRYFGLFLIAQNINSSPTQTTYLFSHGLAADNKQIENYLRFSSKSDSKISSESKLENPRYILDNPCYTFDYPDATKQFWRINFWKTSLAQDEEILHLKEAYNKIPLTAKEPYTVVLFGISRGAATACSFTAQEHPENLSALILESPFSSIQDILLNKCIQIHPKLKNVSPKFLGFLAQLAFWRYKPKGPSPITDAQYIKEDLPILLICSKTDQIVPYESTISLYHKLQKTGHKNTHLLILEQGKHGKLIMGETGEIYRNVVHAFYEQYQLPHNSLYANLGRIEFQKTQQLF